MTELCWSGAREIGAIFVALVAACSIEGRTLELTDEDCEQMAMISSEAPRLSWACFQASEGAFGTYYVDMYSYRGFLIRYPIDRVPAGQKIINAEWLLPVNYMVPNSEQRVYVRRLLASWGPGVCQQYRMVRPKKLAWAVPGARGGSSDRVTKPTAVVRAAAAGDIAVNVTEDVELWYTGAAPNNGWILNMEDENVLVRFPSPVWAGRGSWKLRITYEPK